MSETQTNVQPIRPQPETDEGSCVLLVGGPGSGKSFSLSTVVQDTGLDLCVLGTEPRFRESIEQSFRERKLDLNRLHYCHVYPAATSWHLLIEAATNINTLSFQSLSGMKGGFNKEKYQQFIEVLRALANFKDERTGKLLGPVDQLDPTKYAVAIDSLTGLAMMSMDCTVGSRPTIAEGEWGVAMNQLERLGNTCTAMIKCFFVMTGHIERETDPVTQASQLYVSTLGRKLSPKWGRFYSEVVHAYREGSKYYWSTVTPMFDLKKRFLPLSDKIEPNFAPLIKAWQKRRSSTEGM